MVVSEQILCKHIYIFHNSLSFFLLSFQCDATCYKKLFFLKSTWKSKIIAFFHRKLQQSGNLNSCRCPLAHFRWPDLSKVGIQDFSAPEQPKWCRNTWMNHVHSVAAWRTLVGSPSFIELHQKFLLLPLRQRSIRPIKVEIRATVKHGEMNTFHVRVYTWASKSAQALTILLGKLWYFREGDWREKFLKSVVSTGVKT